MITAKAKVSGKMSYRTMCSVKIKTIVKGSEYAIGAFSFGSKNLVQLKGGGFFDVSSFTFYEDGVEFNPVADKRYNWNIN